MRKIMGLALGFLLSLSNLAGAQDKYTHEYKDSAEVEDAKWDTEQCHVFIHDESEVTAEYRNKKGTLSLTMDDQSDLTVTGEAHALVLVMLKGQCELDLKGLAVGAGGITLVMVKGQCDVTLGPSEGGLIIKSVKGQSDITYKKGTKVTGKENVKGESSLTEK